MRCPDCNKFVGLELVDPEIESPECEELESDARGVVTNLGVHVSARICRTCADCGVELKEANFDLDGEIEISHKKKDDECEFEVVVTEEEATERLGGNEKSPMRYRPCFFGVRVVLTARCSCGADNLGAVELSDETPASGMDEMV